MPSFLFNATNNQDRAVTENIDAENLSQARWKLELRGYTAIEFLNTEISGDVVDMFDEHVKSEAGANPDIQEILFRDNRTATYLKVMLKATALFWVPLLIWMVWTASTYSFVAAGIFVFLFAYISLPTILYTQLTNAVFMARRRKALFWIAAARAFNAVCFLRIPYPDLDMRRSCLDAQAGDIGSALGRMAKYQDHAKVSKRIYYSYLYTLNGYAKRFDEVLRYQSISIDAGNDFAEELLDHALTLARRRRDTVKARELVDRVLDKEVSVLVAAFVSLTRGIIEVEDGRLELAEFYLRDAQRRMEPFKNNESLVGSRSEMNAFLAIALRARGEVDEADRLADEARPFLIAHRETELLERCTAI